MLVWLIFAFMTAAVLAVLIRPLGKRPGMGEDAAGPETAIYRDQLAEIDADLARGLISDGEAAGARIEVSRRLLAAADGEDREGLGDAAAQPLSPNIAYGLAVLVAGIALSFYLMRGAPWLDSQPHAQRVATQASKTSKLADLIGAVEKRLRDHPEDGRGWDVIAPVYLRQGRYANAARAYRQASRLLGEKAQRLAGFAQATILENDGVVTEPARKAYKKVLALHPKEAEPRFWLAVAKEQDGQLEAAATDFQSLLKKAPTDARWRRLVEARLVAVQKKLGRPVAPTLASPTQDDIAAAGKMKPGARNAMIWQMVASLAARMKEDSGNVEGWKRLLRSYVVLGQRDKAGEALKTARKRLAGNKSGLAAIDALAKELGLGS